MMGRLELTWFSIWVLNYLLEQKRLHCLGGFVFPGFEKDLADCQTDKAAEGKGQEKRTKGCIEQI